MKVQCFFLFFTTLALPAFADIKVADVSYEKKSNSLGTLIIKYSGELLNPPELNLSQNNIQITLSGAKLGGRIDKEINLTGSDQDTFLVASQENRDQVKVKLTLPFKTAHLANQTSVTVKNDFVALDFPLGASVVTPQAAAKVKKEKDQGPGYDEEFLNKLLADKKKNSEEVVDIKTAKSSPKLDELEKKLFKNDEISNALSSPQKKEIPIFNNQKRTESNINPVKYAAKFAGFLIVVLALFFVVVHFFRRGVLSKNKLGFLNSAPVISILSTTYIGPKRSLMLVKVYNQVFLLGCAEGGINILSEIDEVPGLLKEGEKSVTGKNFDTDLAQMGELSNLEEKIKMKDKIEVSKEGPATKALKALAQGAVQEKVKFSEELKKKVKGLRPMQ